MLIPRDTVSDVETGKKWFCTVRWNGYNMFLSGILAFAIVLMTRVHFSGMVSGTVEENYFSDFGLSALLLFFFLLVFFYLFIPLVNSVLHEYIKQYCFQEKTVDSFKQLRFWGFLIGITWFPYYLSYYPGGIYSDTFTSISYSLTGVLCNRHPLFYNLLIDLAIKFGDFFNKNLEWSMGFFLAIQMLLMEIELIYFLYWMIIHQVHSRVRNCVMIFMTFFPLMPLYAISIWKDTPFAMAFMLWYMFAIDLYIEIKKNEWHFKTLAGFMTGMFLVAFTRNNGVYVVSFVAVIFILLTITCRFAKKVIIYGGLFLSVIMIIFVQGPVYRHIGVIPTDIVENIGIPIQQICSVVVMDGNITESQKESINRFIPYENIPKYFRPCVVDGVKWSAGMDWEYLDLHKPEFWDLWRHLFLQNPEIYIQEYLLETLGFWDVDVAGYNGYVQVEVWDNDYELVSTDYFERIFGFSFQHFVNPRYYISCAWFFWFFFIYMIFIMRHYGFQNSFLFMPQMAVWLTLMVATPIALSLRYISALLFTLPFVVIVPILLEREVI